MKNYPILWAAAMVGIGVGCPNAAIAQQSEPATPLADVSTKIDPIAFTTLMACANYLASQRQLSFRWTLAQDEVDEPDHVSVFVQSGITKFKRDAGFVAYTQRLGKSRNYYYDGKSFSIAAPEEGFYASQPFQGNFDELVTAAEERIGTSLPLWSMLSGNLPQDLRDNVETARYLGQAEIDGQPAHHLSFSGSGNEWEIWISMDPKRPVPLKLLGTLGADDSDDLQYFASMSDWEFPSDMSEAEFHYSPSELVQRIYLPALADAAGK